MTLPANTWAKPVAIVAAVLAVIGLWAYLAGGIFLQIYGRRFEDATPLTLYQYWVYYGTVPAVMKWLYVSAGASGLITLSPGLLFFGSAKRSLHGDARFAKRREIEKAGLLGEKGIIVGKLGNKYLTFPGQQHVIISAPTRSGKGVGIVIPNLLNWPDSVVVLDIKQENWDITSGFRRKHGQACYLFNPAPADYRTHRYNPLGYISADPNFRIDDIQKIANMLFPDQQGVDPIWTATPRGLFLGVVLYLAETPGKLVTLGQVRRETLAEGDGSAYFTRIVNERAKEGNPLSPVCVEALNSYVSIASDDTRSGVMASFRSRLELWANPLVDAATSANDFDLRDLRKRRMSIYIGVTPDNLDRMGPLLNLFFQQLLDLNTRELPNQNKDIKYACMLLMDEFTAMGKIPIMSKGISYIAGYWLRMMPIIQSPAQLVEVYGKEAAQTFRTNHALQIIYPPKASDTETARDISEWLGYQTVKGVSESKAKGFFAKKNETESESDQRRALLLPQEITSLGSDKEIVVIENVPPILAKKVTYYADHAFIDRLKSVSKRLQTLGKAMPKQRELDDAITSGELGAPVSKIDIDVHNSMFCNVNSPTIAEPQKSKKEVIEVERAAEPEDVPTFAGLDLAAFAVDFSAIEAPGADADEATLRAYADSLCNQVGAYADA